MSKRVSAIMTNKEYYRKYYEEHKESYKKYSRKYRMEHPDKMRELRREHYQRHRRQEILARKCYKQEHPEINEAHVKARGMPFQDHCEICGSTGKLLKHHFDYSKPLDVHTFCYKCHGFIHVIERNIRDPKVVRLLVDN
jgi:hypothetical protein